jgi:hypothetical protein
MAGGLGLAPHRLVVLADEIGQEVRKAEEAWRDAVGHAVKAGEKLIEAKALVKHGEWLPWLDAYFPGSARTASTYMRLAANSEAVADLPTIREAVAALVQPKELPASEKVRLDETEAEVVGALTDGALALMGVAQIEELARRMVEEKNRGGETNPLLMESEVAIQSAELLRKRSARAALSMAAELSTRNPRYAAACADLAAVYLDEDLGPWDSRYGEAEERWAVESAKLERDGSS